MAQKPNPKLADLLVPQVGTLTVAPRPTAGQGLALGLDGTIDSKLLKGYPNNNARLLQGNGVWGGNHLAYSVAISFSGGGGSLGNGTLTGRFTQLGTLVHTYGAFTLGSTTVWGTGFLKISLPGTCVNSSQRALGSVTLAQNSTGNQAYTSAELLNSTTFGPVVTSTFLGTASFLTSAVPWTWATGDSINWTITYESA